MIKKINIFFITSVILLLNLLSVTAVSIGVSPGVAHFDKMLKGGYAEDVVRISTSSIEPIQGHLEISGDVTEWLSFVPENTTFLISRYKPYDLKIIALPPDTTQNGDYKGTINFLTDRLDPLNSGSNTIVKASVLFGVNVNIIGDEIVECGIRNLKIDDAEVDFPLVLSYSIKNTGNVRINPTLTIDIWDKFQRNLIDSYTVGQNSVLPTVESFFIKNLTNRLETGQYWATITDNTCGNSYLITFDVLEKGEVSDKGVFVSLYTDAIAFLDRPLLVNAYFRNDGKRTVSAKFKGEIYYNNQLLAVPESEEIDVAPGEKVNLLSYFTPDTIGRYVLKGRVYYNKKITFEKTSEFRVQKAPGIYVRIIPLIVYLIILSIIIFLIIKISRERRNSKFH